MNGLQEKYIEYDNERINKSICIDQLIWENISTKKVLYQIIYLLNDLHTRENNHQKLLQGFQDYFTVPNNIWKKAIF